MELVANEEINEREVRITRIDPRGPIEKTDFPFAISWYAPVTYTLEDGRTIEGKMGVFRRKRDAVEGGAAREVTNMVARFNEAGDFWGTSTRFTLGIARSA